MTLKLYNTLSRKIEVFKPVKGKEVKMYSCGPTVYWYQHIGNLRTYIFVDLLKRTLSYNGFKIKNIINITDVGHLTSDADTGEDKMEKAAEKEGKSAQEIAKFYFDVFHQDLKNLNILEPSKWVKATDHIEEQINLIETLEKKGYIYKTSDGIYFDTSKLKDYGKLVKLQEINLKAGKRIAVGEKKSKTDFALWKFSSPEEKRQQEWNSPWGLGFPGWHIECSAMSLEYLGKTFDIHTGGQEHAPVHHTNEIAQSESATGKKFVNYWMHTAWLVNKSGEKISKSTGGLYTLSELVDLGYPALSYRYFCLMTHYKKPLIFTLDALDAAKNAYNNLKRKILELKKEKHKAQNKTIEYEKQFKEAINENLNIPKALQVFWDTINDFDFDPKLKIKLLENFDSVLGLGIKDFKEEKIEIPKEVESLLKLRNSLRKEKKWKEADETRDKIFSLGYNIEDAPEGTKLIKR